MEYPVKEILKILKADLPVEKLHEATIRDLLIDSRKLISAEHALFFALQSKRNDGHQYIGDLYTKGVRNFVVSTLPSEPENYPEANFILVKDTLKALQMLAKAHREKFDIPVIGITGSNGKTIVKEWLYQLIGKDRVTIRSPKSYNSQIGVPLSVWQMDPHNEIAIFEAGISEPDEMDRLQAIIKPAIGIFTNIGEAHSENFINQHQKVGEKLKLFTKVDTLIYCMDHSEVMEIIIRSGILKTIKTFTWSRKQASDLYITETQKNQNNSTMIRARFREEDIQINIPFSDDASIENAIHCWATMLHMGYKSDEIAPRFEKLTHVAMRLELKDGINHCTIINDTYNSDINSLSIAIDFLKQQANHRHKTVILSDILQSGKDEEELYSRIAEILQTKEIDRLIGIGPAIARQAERFNLEKTFYPGTEDFIKKFSFTSFSNEVILLKGARIFEFEQISNALQQKTHETVMEINLNALVHNLNYFRTRIHPSTKLMAMVKAFSYGIGSYEIANALQFHRVDYLAVAYADEGVELRKSGIALPIMVMNTDEQSLDAIIQHNLEPEIYSFRMLGLLEKAIKKHILPKDKPVKVHIKLDTGMHRLGFMEEDIEPLIDLLKKNSMIYVQSVFSHLAAADMAIHDDFTHQQISLYESMAGKIKEAAGHKVLMHILNSAGISRHSFAQFDMVRLGISLYGVPSIEFDRDKLEIVSKLRSTISQIKNIAPGESIGYERNYLVDHPMKIAIIPIGYADGLSRKLSNGKGHLWINGKLAPIVGNVCMDVCMADISEIKAEEGDEVLIFGQDRLIEDLAKEMDTIPYEVLTSISKRVKRVYFHE